MKQVDAIYVQQYIELIETKKTGFYDVNINIETFLIIRNGCKKI